MAHGGDFGSDVDRLVQRRPVRRHRRDPADHRRRSTPWPTSATYDWASVEPSIFGTLFERTLDPGKRSPDRRPLHQPPGHRNPSRSRCCWRRCGGNGRRSSGGARMSFGPRSSRPAGRGAARPAPRTRGSARRSTGRSSTSPSGWRHVTVLDPACGSGNFLYVAIHMLLDLEKEVIAYAATRGLSLVPAGQPVAAARAGDQPLRPAACAGGDLDRLSPVDALQRVQDARPSGAGADREHPPMDAILDLSDPEHPKEPEWPEAEFIVGNPPFLGDKKIEAGLGDELRATLCPALRRMRCRASPTSAAIGLRRLASDIEAARATRRASRYNKESIGCQTARFEAIKESANLLCDFDRDWILRAPRFTFRWSGLEAEQDSREELRGRREESFADQFGLNRRF